MRTWRCDHPQTEANTLRNGYCRTCFNAYQREYEKSPEGRDVRARSLLPGRLEAARLRLSYYEGQARRLGMEHLL